MPRSEDFAGRVNYAAAVISADRATSRAFDGCFENHDGDEVVTALVRRAENNPRLADKLFKYLAKDTALAAAERLKDVPTRELPRVAAATRERAHAEFEAMMARRDELQNAIAEAGRAAGYRIEKTGPFEFWAVRPDGTRVNPWANSLERDAWHFAGRDARPDLPTH